MDKYIDRISDNKLINVERAKAYRDVIQSIERIPLDQRIHSVTLPTGLGKTLLSASWALKLRNRIEKEWNFSPKIIVSLPFLSIIEQTDEEYKQFLKEIYAKYGIGGFCVRDRPDIENKILDFIENSKLLVPLDKISK